MAASVIILGLAISFVFSSFITLPIKKVNRNIEKLKSGKDVEELKIISRDELGELTKNFNELAQIVMKQKQGFKNYASDLERTFIDTLRILIAAIDSRDDYTFGHSTRVAKMSLLIGRRLNLDTQSLKKLQMTCLFHDVGKIRLSDNILNKNSFLERAERIQMNKHPEHGAEILRLADSLRQYIPSVLHHHEWYDGTGYPAGIKGKQIPVFSAIISLTDAYDAMTSKRPYRDNMSKEEAVEELQRCSGTQFDPHLTDIFISILNGLWREEES